MQQNSRLLDEDTLYRVVVAFLSGIAAAAMELGLIGNGWVALALLIVVFLWILHGFATLDRRRAEQQEIISRQTLALRDEIDRLRIVCEAHGVHPDGTQSVPQISGTKH